MNYIGSPQWAIDSLNFINSEIYEAQRKYFSKNRIDQRLPRVIIHCGTKHCSAVMRLLSDCNQVPAYPLELHGAKIYHVLGSGELYFNIQDLPAAEL